MGETASKEVDMHDQTGIRYEYLIPIPRSHRGEEYSIASAAIPKGADEACWF